MTSVNLSNTSDIDVEGMSEYLSQAHVEFAILFGSNVRGDDDEGSDVDVAIHFSDDIDERERFRRRNRIDAELQTYADEFVDVSDIENFPIHVARAALQEGHFLAGDRSALDEYTAQVEAEYEAESADRAEERRQFIDRLARGDV